MRYFSVAFILLALVALSPLATSFAGSERAPAIIALEAQETNPVEMSEESVAAGRVVYARFCRSCHGTAGEGDGGGAPEGALPANLVDEEWDFGDTDVEIFNTIADGIPPDYFMEPWAGRIPDEDIWNTVNYLRDLANRD